MRQALLISLLFFLALESSGQQPHRSYQAGEHIQYRAVYNWGVLWLNAGTVDFYVSDTTFKGEKALKFESIGRSYPSYDWFFKVRDTFISIVPHSSSQPLFFTRKTSEGGYKVNNWVDYNYSDKELVAKTENSDKKASIDTIPMLNDVYDVISGVYRTRNISFERCRINDTIPISMIIDGVVEKLYLRYLGREVLKTRDGRSFRTIKFSSLLVKGTIFKGGEDLTVWVTDDRNRIPIMVEAKILVGNVKALFVDAKGLKYPMEAEIMK
ncbi:MAG: DUF3108 domain-containing protein [Bacteroidales bacterium]|jgi:hypothetical protein